MSELLIVDDDASMRALLRMTLEQEGHHVVLATNGREAVRLCDEFPIELVITDIMMPEMDGLQLITALRRSKPALPIIAMSGGIANVQPNLETARELGAAHVLEKPFKLNVLVAAIDRLLHESEASY